MNRHSYLGRDFEVWNGAQSWFWMVPGPNRNGGTVGAAASRADALRAACMLIEEAEAVPLPTASNSIVETFLGWERMLSNLALHIARECCESA